MKESTRKRRIHGRLNELARAKSASKIDRSLELSRANIDKYREHDESKGDKRNEGLGHCRCRWQHRIVHCPVCYAISPTRRRGFYEMQMSGSRTASQPRHQLGHQ